jgi:PKD repeat protein
MQKKTILILLILVLGLACLPMVSAVTTGVGNNPADHVIAGSAGQPLSSSGLPLLKAQIAEETTTEPLEPTMEPVTYPTEEPTTIQTPEPTLAPTTEPTPVPTYEPTVLPTTEETYQPTTEPTLLPTGEETTEPVTEPTLLPTGEETTLPIPGPLAPVADFVASPGSGSGPLAVRFTDTSLNSPTMWYWDFGDGATDSLTGAPSHTYADPGSYTVTMTSSNMYGTDTITKTDYVTVNGQVMSNGAISAQSVPSGAAIFVNGNSYGNAPVTIRDLFPGTYSVMATLNGYYPDQQTITVPPGRTAGYYPTLRSSPNPPVITGTISARSTPSGATIYVNGVNYGTTPFTIVNQIPGTYSMAASLDGYSSDTQLITVNPGQTTSYYPTLQPSPGPARTGTIFAQSSPAGATIYLNGISYGSAPVTIPNLLPASYTMKATLSGYPADTQRITVSPGHASLYTPTFYPAPQPIGSGQGILAVYSNIDGAQVFFDNVNQGSIKNGVLFVPVSVTGTPSRTYRVESPGYTPLTGTISRWPASLETVKIQATLIPLPLPTTGHAPLPITVTLGAVIGAGFILFIAPGRRGNR